MKWTLLANIISLVAAATFVQQPATSQKQLVEPLIPENQVSTTTTAILRDLRACESQGRDSAINPKDRDLTPSWGRYQFKPSTLYGWGKQYGTITDMEPAEIMNVIMDGDLQERTLIEVLKDHQKDKRWWNQQFPDCGNKYKFWNY